MDFGDIRDPRKEAPFRWREVKGTGLFFRNYTGGARSADTLEDAVDYCADCRTEIPAGDYYCGDCCE